MYNSFSQNDSWNEGGIMFCLIGLSFASCMQLYADMYVTHWLTLGEHSHRVTSSYNDASMMDFTKFMSPSIMTTLRKNSPK